MLSVNKSLSENERFTLSTPCPEAFLLSIKLCIKLKKNYSHTVRAKFLSAPSSFMLATPLPYLQMILLGNPFTCGTYFSPLEKMTRRTKTLSYFPCLSLSSSDNEVFRMWGKLVRLAETGEIMTAKKDSRANWIMNLVLIGRGARVQLPDSLRISGSNENSWSRSGPTSGVFGALERHRNCRRQGGNRGVTRLQSRRVGRAFTLISDLRLRGSFGDEMDIAICFHRRRGNKMKRFQAGEPKGKPKNPNQYLHLKEQQ